MQAVATTHTGPELVVRSLLHSLGYRYRLHGAQLPGRPDIVLRRQKAVVFVHGCFWHGHGCQKGRPPKSKLDYWLPKLAANRARDERNLKELRTTGWRVLVVWQCECANHARLQRKLVKFLGPRRQTDRL